MPLIRALRTIALAAVAFFGATQAQAIPVIEFFDAIIEVGPAAGETGTLTIEYDDADVDPVGSVDLFEDQFDLVLEILGGTFTEADDIDFPFFPFLAFEDGEIVGLDFVIADPAPGVAAIGGFEILDGTYFMGSEAVPLPGTALLAALGLLIMGRFRRV